MNSIADLLQALPDFSEEELQISPLGISQTIPSSWYTDSRYLELEKHVLFASSWQYVGHECRLPHPGDHIVADIVGNPVVVVRGNDGRIRAFFNVCRHRGGPLAVCDGYGKMLQCKYHGWTYTLEGQLRGIPKFDRTELFDKKDYGLVPLALDSWEGMLFVQVTPGRVPLARHLAGIRERIAPHQPSSMKFFRRVDYTVNCNWKVYVDNYLEGYHVPLVHPSLSSILDYQQYVTELMEHYTLQHSPLSDENRSYGIETGGTAYYFHVVPNFMMNVLPGRLQTNLVLPVTHNITRVVFDYYYLDVSASAQSRIEEDIRCSDFIQKEDMEICEHVQKGLESAAYDKGRFSAEMESAVHHFQSWLKREFRSFRDTSIMLHNDS
jgi:choline monooxygenase